MKIYLQVKYEERLRAKETAMNNGTRIRWDAEKRAWYWEGGKVLPAYLQKYAYPTDMISKTVSKQYLNVKKRLSTTCEQIHYTPDGLGGLYVYIYYSRTETNVLHIDFLGMVFDEQGRQIL